MQLAEFKYDANHAAVIKHEKRQVSNGDVIERVTFDNGVIFVYTKTSNGFKRLDTNFELIKLISGYYMSDLNSPKVDFNDYY